MKRIVNEMKLRLPAISENEAVCRSVISAFAAALDPTAAEIGDLRLAVSEAVTNCIVHAYGEGYRDSECYIYISARLYDSREITVEVADRGRGIPNVEAAMHPGYTTGGASERCGMGFLVMESFTDSLRVRSRVGRGTTVLMRKILSPVSE